jgi:hypothetical protein
MLDGQGRTQKANNHPNGPVTEPQGGLEPGGPDLICLRAHLAGPHAADFRDMTKENLLSKFQGKKSCNNKKTHSRSSK